MWRFNWKEHSRATRERSIRQISSAGDGDRKGVTNGEKPNNNKAVAAGGGLNWTGDRRGRDGHMAGAMGSGLRPCP